jgi:hypothetical protein
MEITMYKLDRTQSIVAMDGNVIAPVPALVENYMLDKIMTKIRLEGELEQVLTIVQKVEKRFPKYRDTLWYKLVHAGPPELIESIRKEFQKTSLTQDFFRYLDWDKQEISKCQVIYLCTLILTALSVAAICLVPLKIYSPLLIIVPWGACITVQLNFFEHTMKYICFVKVYEQICNVLENHYREHCAYVQKVISLPEQVRQRQQEMQRNKLLDSMSAEEIRHRQELELKTAESLQELAALVAINQATTEDEIRQIQDKTKLNYRKSELNIHDEIDERKRRHELAKSAIKSMGQFLIERGKSLSEDDQEKRNIAYQLRLLNGIRGKLQSGGNAAVADESVYESINKMMEMMANPQESIPVL